MGCAIEAQNLTKDFGNFRAVDSISFKVERGETFAILGENGAGKSTTMRMIACRSPLTGGQLLVEGLEVAKNERQIRSIIGVVPQENNLDPDLNVRENLLVYSRYYRLSIPEAEKRTDELIEFINLKHKEKAKVDHLSGGMKRRLIIARSLIHRPKILLLDEPTTGLDPHVRQEIWEKLEELRRFDNLTILLSTHYMDEAEKLAQRLVLMSKGKIVVEGVPHQIIEERVKKYALEIREAGNIDIKRVKKEIIGQKRGTIHLYFADSPEELSGLMKFYENHPLLLRPSNLEDVFLQTVNSQS